MEIYVAAVVGMCIANAVIRLVLLGKGAELRYTRGQLAFSVAEGLAWASWGIWVLTR